MGLAACGFIDGRLDGWEKIFEPSEHCQISYPFTELIFFFSTYAS
jgi:hypothetical protein